MEYFHSPPYLCILQKVCHVSAAVHMSDHHNASGIKLSFHYDGGFGLTMTVTVSLLIQASMDQ